MQAQHHINDVAPAGAQPVAITAGHNAAEVRLFNLENKGAAEVVHDVAPAGAQPVAIAAREQKQRIGWIKGRAAAYSGASAGAVPSTRTN